MDDNILEKVSRLLRLRNYSPKTRKTYLFYIKDYITFSKKNNIKNKQKVIEDFLLEKHKKKQSPQTINLALSAVKFLYLEVLENPEKIDLKFAKRSKKLPVALSRFEIEKIIRSTENEKYRLMISLGYSCGLRVSEVVDLKGADLDISELTIHIKGAKGKKIELPYYQKKFRMTYEIA